MGDVRIRTVFFVALTALVACGAEPAEIIDTDPGHCRHGLVNHALGDFSVFLFCDDALGTQIGVIYSKPGAGPVERDSEWSTINRFWQEGAWMTDVNQLLWSESGGHLYVVTGMAYGDNSLYELDLRHRTAKKLFSGKRDGGQIRMTLSGSRTISIDDETFEIQE